MMTKQRKTRLKQKIQASRERLMESHPFFALLLMYLKFVAVPETKKISTNGRCIYFSPDFIEKLYEYELDYILCHQIMHIACSHIWRPYDREGDDYHFACDIIVNAILADCGFLKERYPHLGYVYRKISEKGINPYETTAEDVFEQLPYSLYVFDERTRGKFLMDDEVWWNQKEDSGRFGEIILDLPEMEALLRDKAGGASDTYEEKGDLQQEWQGRVRFAVKNANLNEGAGNIPEFAKRMLQNMKAPVIDWKKILNNFVQESICDYSFSPPDRRFSDTGFFLPDFNEKDFVSKEILFMADTSGSVEDGDLAKVYSEIKGAIEQFGGKLTGKLGFFDAAVTPPIQFDNIEDLMRIVPYGGGGTDFTVIFDYLKRHRENELPACIIIFTDGDGPYPDESEAMGIPVLWIINNLEFTPPWGRITRMTDYSAAQND